MNLGFAGRYQLIKHKTDAAGEIIPGSAEVILPWFHNLITNQGLNYLGSSTQDNLTYCQIGTSNTTPANTDVALGALEGYAGILSGSPVAGVGPGGLYVYRRVTYRFAAGAVDGVNLAEVGVSAATSGGIFSHALLTDSNGDPTTITLDAAEVLDVVFEIRCYFPQSDSTVAATIDGVSTTVTLRFNTNTAQLTSWAHTLGAGFTTTAPNGAAWNPVTAYETQPDASTGWSTDDYPLASSKRTYVANSYQAVFDVTVPLAVANFPTGLGSLSVGATNWNPNDARTWVAMPAMSFGFNPKLNKTSSRTAAIAVGVSWGRYTP